MNHHFGGSIAARDTVLRAIDETESPGHRPGLFVIRFIAPSAFAGKLPPASFKLLGHRSPAGAAAINRLHPFRVIRLDERLALIRKLRPVDDEIGRAVDAMSCREPIPSRPATRRARTGFRRRRDSTRRHRRLHGRPCRWFSPGRSAFPAHRRRESRPPKPSRRRRCRGCRCWCVASRICCSCRNRCRTGMCCHRCH